MKRKAINRAESKTIEIYRKISENGLQKFLEAPRKNFCDSIKNAYKAKQKFQRMANILFAGKTPPKANLPRAVARKVDIVRQNDFLACITVAAVYAL